MNGEKWVEACADCTPELTFRRLVETMKTDVNRFNKLKPAQRKNMNFRVRQDGDGWVVEPTRPILQGGQTIYDADPAHEDDVVRIDFTNDAIVAERCGVMRLDIEPVWNEETLTCDLMIGGRAFPPCHVSQ